MAWRQVYYTSCTTGLRSGKGFQVNAATPGIDASVLQQIERLGIYMPPVSAPSRPSAEELEQFPTTLLFARLLDGSAVVAQAKYAGADYSGRFGNFFTHSLLTSKPEDELRSVLPVELWRSPMWCTAESANTTLPPLDALTPGGVITVSHVQDFLRNGRRFEHLAPMITAVEQALLTKRKVIIVEESQAIAVWIAAASYALPRHLALQLTFNTYAKNPYQCDALVIGTTPNSDFKLASHEIDHQYSVFDFVGNRYTKFPVTSPFAQTVSRAYEAGRVDEVSRFGAFVAETAPTLTVAELNTAFAVYSAARGFPNDGTAHDELITWCTAHVAHLSLETITLILKTVMAGGASNPKVIEVCSDLYRSSQAPSVPAAVRAGIESAYLQWMLKEVLRSAPVEALTRVISRVTYPPSATEIARSLRSTWLSQMRQMQEPARISISLATGDLLGLLAEDDDMLRRVAENTIGPALVDAAIQSSIEKLLAKPSGRALLHGIGAHLETRVGDAQTFSKLARFLGRPAIADNLERFAIEGKSFGLYCRILGARASLQPDRRESLFERCISTFRAQGADFEGYIDNAFDAIWPNGALTVDEAVRLSALVNLQAFPTTLIPARLLSVLLSGKDVQRRELLASKGEVAEALTHAAMMRRRDEDRSKAVRAAIECSARLSQDLAAGLFDLAAERLVEIDLLDQHVDLLLKANDATRGRFMSQYRTAVCAYLSSSRVNRAPTAARIFLIALRLEKSRWDGLQLASPLLRDVLPEALKDWTKDDLDKMGEVIARDRDPSVKRFWQRWRESVRPSGMFSRLKLWGR